MAVVVIQPSGSDGWVAFQPDAVTRRPEPYPVADNPCRREPGFDGSASCQDCLRRRHGRFAVPTAWLSGAAEYEVVAMRVDGDQVGRVAGVCLGELGDPWIRGDQVLAPDREQAVVPGQ